MKSTHAGSEGGGRLPRELHPGAWWIWAVGMATAASRTSNPLLLVLIIASVVMVVASRRSNESWARGFNMYLVFGLVIIVLRVVFRMLLDGQYGQHVLFTLPELALPDAAAGITIGGPVSLEGILAAVYDGLLLAALLVCLGSTNVLANPKRMLRSVPSALYEVGTAITVAITVAPQLIDSAVRVNRARRLRGGVGRRTHWFAQVVIPVMTDALDRSLLLAAAMDSRGYGRTSGTSRSGRRVTAVLVIGGLAGICVGVYGLLDSSTPWALGVPMLAVGAIVSVIGFVGSGARVPRTRYRPQRWRIEEYVVAASGVITAVVLIVVSVKDPPGLHPSLQPLAWPQLPTVATLGILIGVTPAWVAPRVPSTTGTTHPGHLKPFTDASAAGTRGDDAGRSIRGATRPDGMQPDDRQSDDRPLEVRS